MQRCDEKNSRTLYVLVHKVIGIFELLADAKDSPTGSKHLHKETTP